MATHLKNVKCKPRNIKLYMGAMKNDTENYDTFNINIKNIIYTLSDLYFLFQDVDDK